MVVSDKLKDLTFPTLEFTNDSNGKLLLNIVFAMSKQYSEHLSESVQRGVNSKRLFLLWYSRPDWTES